jgi:hypothetical protein
VAACSFTFMRGSGCPEAVAQNVRLFFRLLLILSFFLHSGVLSAQQTSNGNSVAPHGPGAKSPSLKICLRLPDSSAFSGMVSLHVARAEGSAVVGKPPDSEGESIFSNLVPGSYSVDATAPGFVSVKQSVEIKLGNGLQTVFLVMKPDTSANAPSAPPFGAATANEPFPIPPGIDEVVPAVSPGVECDLPVVLHGVGERMTQLVSNLEKFSATEHVTHFSVDKRGVLRDHETRSFEYVVVISQNAFQGFLLDEYRNGNTNPAQFPAGIATTGLPVMGAIFHPVMVSDFNFSCEGLGQWNGHPAWQVRFEQRLDRLNRIRAYNVGGNYYSVALKGRAWIDAGTYQVLRLETDLVKPVEEMELTHERLSIEYGEVQFHTHEVQLWLPKSAELYWERHKHRYYRRHDFTNFKIFSVDTDQKYQRPKESYSFTNTSDRDIPGVLVVSPVSSSTLSPVSIAFTIPAGRSVFKTIGTGKDVGIPGELVGSAKYVYKGQADSVKVDAYLATESTLEVVPDSTP